MSATRIRKQLQKEIDKLPDDLVQQVADFTLFLMARRQMKPSYVDWEDDQWQAFALEQFFREEDEVEYTTPIR